MKLHQGYLKYPSKIPSMHCYLFTANRVVKNNGELVMGGGNALAAAMAYPELPAICGKCIDKNPAAVFEVFAKGSGIYGFLVTKDHFKDASDIVLVENGISELDICAKTNPDWTFHLPFPAIGLGGLRREDVLPYLEKLPDNVIVYE